MPFIEIDNQPLTTCFGITLLNADTALVNCMTQNNSKNNLQNLFFLIKLNDEFPKAVPYLDDHWFDQSVKLRSRKAVKYYTQVDQNWSFELNILLMTPFSDYSKSCESYIDTYRIDPTTFAPVYTNTLTSKTFSTSNFVLADIFSFGRNVYLLEQTQLIRF